MLKRRVSPNGIPNRQVLEPSDERGGGKLRWSRKLDRCQPRNELTDQPAHLHPRQCRAEAEVHTVAKRQVLVGLPRNIEAERFVEHLLVAVARDGGHVLRFTSRDGGTA